MVAGEQYPMKLQIVSKSPEAALEKQLDVFKLHQYNFIWQHSEMKHLKQNLDINSAVNQVD